MVNMLHCHRYPLLTKLWCEQYIVYSVAIVPDVLTVHSIDDFFFFSPPPHLIQGGERNLLWIESQTKTSRQCLRSIFHQWLSFTPFNFILFYKLDQMSKRLQSWWLFSVEIFAGVGAIVHMSAYIIAVSHLLKDDTLYL